MLGIWMHKCISLILNRYNILKYSIKNYEILSTTVYKSQNYDLSCKNVNNFSIICNNGTWNNIFFSKILNHLDHNININFINCNYLKNKEKKKSLIKKKLKNISSNLFKKNFKF